jgi:hypothetical protein
MHFITIFFTLFAIPKYFLLIFINATLYVVYNFKNLKLKKNIIVLLECILIFISNFFIIKTYNFSIYLSVGWPLLFSTFYFSLAHNNNFITKDNFVTVLKIGCFSLFFFILVLIITGLIVEYPILRNGLISPYSLIQLLVENKFSLKELSYLDLLVHRVGISYLYIKLYLLTIFIVGLCMIEKGLGKSWIAILPFVLIIGSSFGSRSFVFFYFLSIIAMLIVNKKLGDKILLLVSVLLVIFNINFFKNSNTIDNYLKLFKFSQERLLIVSEKTSNNKLNYAFSDIESFKTFNKRIAVTDTRVASILESRLLDNLYGFYAIITFNHGNKIEEFFKKNYPQGYFLNQKIFHNTFFKFFNIFYIKFYLLL